MGSDTMAAVGRFRYLGLAFFSKPAEDRQLYRLVRKQKVSTVLEIGIGSLPRALSLIGVCQRYSPEKQVRYAAVDLFEERPEGQPKLSLIQAHRELRSAGAKAHLLPGGPDTIEALANSLPGTDLILISPEVTDRQLQNAWFYFPRMCHGPTTVLRACYDEGRIVTKPIGREEIDRFAKGVGGISRAA